MPPLKKFGRWMLVSSVAAAWIQPRNRLKSRETDCFFLSNADTLQAQPDRLAEHGAGLAAQRAEAHHGDACSDQQNLHNGFLRTKHPDHSLLFAMLPWRR